jgi:hypothetical protein
MMDDEMTPKRSKKNFSDLAKFRLFFGSARSTHYLDGLFVLPYCQKKKTQGTLEFSDAGALHATSFLFYYRGGRQKKTQSENTKNDKKTPMNRCQWPRYDIPAWFAYYYCFDDEVVYGKLHRLMNDLAGTAAALLIEYCFWFFQPMPIGFCLPYFMAFRRFGLPGTGSSLFDDLMDCLIFWPAITGLVWTVSGRG